MAMLGPEGLRRVAAGSMTKARALREKLCAIEGVQPMFARAGFHEFALRLSRSASEVVASLAQQNIVAGVALGEDYPELDDALLVCATETKTQADIDFFASAMAGALK